MDSRVRPRDERVVQHTPDGSGNLGKLLVGGPVLFYRFLPGFSSPGSGKVYSTSSILFIHKSKLFPQFYNKLRYHPSFTELL